MNQNYIAKIVELNQFTHIMIQNDYQAGYSRGYSVYLMDSHDYGVNQKSFTTHRAAKAYAEAISKAANIPLRK